MTTGVNDFTTYTPALDDPAEHAFAITPHATNELAHYTRGVLCGTAGNLVCTFVGDTSEVTVPIVAGVVYPFRLRLVNTTSSAATLVGLY